MIDESWTVEVLDAGGVSIAIPCASEGPCPEPAPTIVTARSVVFTDVIDGTPIEGLNWAVEVGDAGVESPPIDGAPTPIEPEAVVVTIAGVERATTLSYGVIDGVDVTFVVPAYRFVGRYADGTDFETITTALDPSVIGTRQP